MPYSFTVGQRLAILDIVPKNPPDYLFCALQNLRMELGFTDSELEVVNFHYDGDVLHWDNELPAPLPETNTILETFCIGPIVKDYLVTELAKLPPKKLVGDYLSVYNLLTD